MTFKAGDPKPPGSGKKKGQPNKSTRDVREAIARFAQSTVEDFARWVSEIDDPAKRCDIYLKALEYHVPKLSRAEVTGEDGGALTVQVVRFADRPRPE